MKHGFHLLGQIGLGQNGAVLEIPPDLGEDPRPAQSAPADGHAVAAGFLIQSQSPFQTGHISVAKDGDGDSLLDLADDADIHRRGVHLLPGPAVDGEGGGSRPLQNLSKLHGVDMLLVPALPEFDCHRHRNCLHHGGHNLPGQLRVLHQGGASAVARHLGGGAAHVDVDDVGVKFHGPPGGFGQGGGLVPEELDRHRPLPVGDGEQGLGLSVRVGQSLRGGHFPYHISAAKLLAHLPEGAVSHPGHGGQGSGFFDFHVADGDIFHG